MISSESHLVLVSILHKYLSFIILDKRLHQQQWNDIIAEYIINLHYNEPVPTTFIKYLAIVSSLCVCVCVRTCMCVLGLSDTAILVSRSILKPLFMILNSSRYLQISQS